MRGIPSSIGRRKSLLPASWNPAKRNVAIFNSSEDEYAATDAQWNNPLYANQLEGLQRIVQSLEADHDDIHVYLRIHPNLIGVNNKHTMALYDLRRDFFEIIPPDDPVSTYALIKARRQSAHFRLDRRDRGGFLGHAKHPCRSEFLPRLGRHLQSRFSRRAHHYAES